jgi:hypothetical protein
MRASEARCSTARIGVLSGLRQKIAVTRLCDLHERDHGALSDAHTTSIRGGEKRIRIIAYLSQRPFEVRVNAARTV